MYKENSTPIAPLPKPTGDPPTLHLEINGHSVTCTFAKEPNPGVFDRVREILIAASFTKKETSNKKAPHEFS